MTVEPFVILVCDRDPMVGVVASRLLASALSTRLTHFPIDIRVMSSESEIIAMNEPELPAAVRNMQQQVASASTSDIELTQLIVGFSGLDVTKVNELRNARVAAPAISLCQFVLNFEEIAHGYEHISQIDVRDVVVGAALQYGFDFGSTHCEICADKVEDSIDYWINIADTCARFASAMQQLQS